MRALSLKPLLKKQNKTKFKIKSLILITNLEND